MDFRYAPRMRVQGYGFSPLRMHGVFVRVRVTQLPRKFLRGSMKRHVLGTRSEQIDIRLWVRRNAFASTPWTRGINLLQVVVMPRQGREELARDRIPPLAVLQDIDDFLRQFEALGAVFLGEAGNSELRCMVDEDRAGDVCLVSNKQCQQRQESTCCEWCQLTW